MNMRRPEEPEHDEFIVLFTALSMILLAFFILLNTMATPDPMRSRKAIDSLVGTFGMLHGNQEGTPAPKSQRMPKPDAVARLIASLNDEHRAAGMSATRREEGAIAIAMQGDLMFASGSWQIDPARFHALDGIAELLKRDARYTARVTGHTDASRSSQVSNLRLSAERAASVRRYLEHAARLTPGTLSSLGHGSSRPHPDHLDEPRSSTHRRVEVTLELIAPQAHERDLAAEGALF